MLSADQRKKANFGRYEILSELGRGAMGVVYKARDPKINRIVAIKTFSLAGQPPEEEQEFRERFFREAEAAGRISHPGIVTIFDVGEEHAVGEHAESRTPYIVMEFVGGEALDKLLSQGERKLPLETALRLTHELASALECAHAQGVVHRDLKPANILITEDGHAKIADFGVAKLNLANFTLAGRALGTPAYMSPEQLSGEAVDGRSDLFSLGVVLYTMLTGYRPFQGNSAMTVSFKVVNRDPVPASVLDTQLPAGVDSIIQRAMAKDPADRYQSGMEMALDLEDLIAGRELRSQAVSPDQPMASGPIAATAASAGNQSQIAAKLNLYNRLESQLVKLVAMVLLGIGIAIFGMRLAPLFRGRTTSATPPAPRVAVTHPMPISGESATLKGENVPAKLAAPPPPPVPAVAAKHAVLPAVDKTIAKNPPKPKIVAKSIPDKKVDPKLVSAKPAPAPVVAEVAPATVVPPPDPATLDIEVDHKFQAAHLSVWVDSELTYTHLLEGTDKKRLVVFHHKEGHEFHAVQVPPGNHEVRVEVTADEGAVDQSTKIKAVFASRKETILHIRFDKHGEMIVALE